MCFTGSRAANPQQWNWDGERIIHECIVPSSRPPIGRKSGDYDVDVREFLITERNAVIRRTLEVDLKKFIARLEGASWELFTSRRPGAFDHRADIIAEFVAHKIKYTRTNGLDPWQFPDETLALKSGDCEDRALLIASLLLASGISSFNVRVVLGKFRAWFDTKHQDFDHVWVMYKDEAGKWRVIEPAQARKVEGKAPREKQLPTRAEYIPYYLFNDAHLWAAQHQAVYGGKGGMSLKRDWSSVHPEFAGWVHRGILNAALTPDVCPSWLLTTLNRHFTEVAGIKSLTVDDVDLPGSYDPRDHFDNGYIAEGWQQVQWRLAQFQSGGVTRLDDFHRAAHGIADFYAHTSYAHFGAAPDGQLGLYDPNNPAATLAQAPRYDAGSTFNLTSGKFSTNAALWKGAAEDAARMAGGKIISGRYAQKRDSQSVFELVTFIPRSLQKASDFSLRGALPHHNEIAVDEPLGKGNAVPKGHVLYAAPDYAAQYQLRYGAAVRHIRQAFQQNWKP